MNGSRVSSKNISRDIALSGVLIAFVFVTTFINIRLPISINGGLIHLGNVPLFIAAIVFGKKKGAIAGAFGMSLFDIFSGWVLWAPFTFIIRGVMGYIIGSISEKKDGKSFILNLIAILVAGIWMIFGYYLTEVILYGNLYTPVTSIIGNVLQIVVGIFITLPIIKFIRVRNY